LQHAAFLHNKLIEQLKNRHPSRGLKPARRIYLAGGLRLPDWAEPALLPPPYSMNNPEDDT
jgi:hypothetical protein